MNIPNLLTLSRITLIPIFVVVFYLPVSWSHMVCATIFAIAALTDWFDGFLARLLSQTSRLGEFLDPVADKLVVAVALVLLAGEHGSALLAIPGAIIVSREILISALREWMAELGKRATVAVGIWGKIKTVIQMVAIFLLLSQPAHPMNFIVIAGYIALYTAAGLTMWSMVVYLKLAWSDLMSSQQSEEQTP